MIALGQPRRRPLVVADDLAETPPAFRSAGRLVAHYAGERRGPLAALLGVVTLAAAAAVTIQYVMKVMVDAMAAPERAAATVWIALGLFVALVAVESLFWRVSGWLGCRLTIAVGIDVRLDLFSYLAGQPMRYFADNLAGALGQRITATAGNLGALVNTVTWRVLPPLVDFLGAVVIFLTIDVGMAAALVLFVAAATGGLLKLGERGRPVHRAYAEMGGRTAGELVDVIANMWAVKAFSARTRETERLAGWFGREGEAQRRSWMFIETTRLVHDGLLVVMAGTILVWAITLWNAGSISPGDVVVISALTFRILHGSRDLALALADTLQQFGFIEDTLRVLGQPRIVVDRPGAPALEPERGEIRIDRVGFGYSAGRPAVDGVDVTIPAGQKVALVGPSGAGKSTLVQLLQRLHDVDTGEIRIDGVPIEAVAQDSLRAALAVVPQEITLYHRTIADNIRVGRPEAPDAEIVAVARAVGADGFIARLPDGYDTIVGDRGLKLSGGQRQRVGIARALLKRAPIIVLDEATSALDTESELVIQRALVTSTADRTVVAVAHRLSTIAAFDRVLVMQAGRIVEDGAPGELRRRGGIFAQMWRMQAEGLAEEAAAE